METFHNRPRPPRTDPPPQAAPSSARDSRCFIATAVYGPEAPQTEELRAFRDRTLMRSALGRAFVRCYYRLSPPVAAGLSRHPRLAAPVRTGLDAMRCVVGRDPPVAPWRSTLASAPGGEPTAGSSNAFSQTADR
ncbi:MAG: CFI-box-CTERM domain-containing protein [Pseudomonas sp.]